MCFQETMVMMLLPTVCWSKICLSKFQTEDSSVFDNKIVIEVKLSINDFPISSQFERKLALLVVLQGESIWKGGSASAGNVH